ncbi:hypothetical protein BLOT_000457, partial [Blomia tropicalis]
NKKVSIIFFTKKSHDQLMKSANAIAVSVDIDGAGERLINSCPRMNEKREERIVKKNDETASFQMISEWYEQLFLEMSVRQTHTTFNVATVLYYTVYIPSF